MKDYRRVWVVYKKELVETLRDRRTLMAMVLVPIVLYPVLMIIIVQALKAETGRRQAERYSICVPTEGHKKWLEFVLQREDAQQAEWDTARQSGRSSQDGADAADELRAQLHAEQVDIVVLGTGQSLWDAIADQACHAGLIVEPPPDPEHPSNGINRIAQIIHSDTDPRSEFVYHQLENILANEAERVVRERVASLPGGERTLMPLLASSLSTSSPQQQFAKILAMVIPFLLVIMTVTGALYPAIDLTAGERERGTLETLAVSPVPVGQIVAGKFGVIVTIAMFSTALNLGSMTAMFHFGRLGELADSLRRPGSAVEELEAEKAIERNSSTQAEGVLSQRYYLEQRRKLEAEATQHKGFITTAAPIVLLAMLPFAVLAGGIMLATCSFARTFKEAQNYMMPVIMAFLIPAMVVSYMPTTKLEGLLLVIPVANIVVLIRELFLGNYQPAAMAVCLLSTGLYAAAAVAAAAKLYAHEAVLFADVGSYKTLLRRRFIRRQTYPPGALAVVLVALVFPLNFYWQSYFIDADASALRLKVVLALSQLFLLAAPAFAVAWYLKLDLRKTFALQPPGALSMVGAILLAVSIVPVANFLRQVQFMFYPPQTGDFAQLGELLLSGSLFWVVLVFAVLPAICEELLFRGFLLAGLRESLRPLTVALVVGIFFGLFHMQIDKIPVHTLLGVLLAAVVLRGGSIYPAMLIHIANNGLALAATRVPWLHTFLGMEEFEANLTQPQLTLRTGAFAAVFLLGLVVTYIGRRGDRFLESVAKNQSGVMHSISG
jgi:sodium transport system permease protein